MNRIILTLLAAFLALPHTAWSQSCNAGPVAVQILGSGGPSINKDRASTSYLL